MSFKASTSYVQLLAREYRQEKAEDQPISNSGASQISFFGSILGTSIPSRTGRPTSRLLTERDVHSPGALSKLVLGRVPENLPVYREIALELMTDEILELRDCQVMLNSPRKIDAVMQI